MECSLDTNLLLRYIWKDIPSQTKKAEKLLNDQSQIFYISDLVIAEVVFNLQGTDAPRKNIVGILRQLFSMKNIRVNTALMERVLPFYEEHPALSFVDCCAAFYADINGREPLWTFDRKLANQHPSAKLA